VSLDRMNSHTGN